MAIAFPKYYPACQTDDNPGIKSGGNLAVADRSGINQSDCDGPYKNGSRRTSRLGKIAIFLYTGKNYTSIEF